VNDPNLAPSSLVDSFQSMSLRKGDTFHPQSNTSQSNFWDPLDSRVGLPSMPSRSATSPQSLEDLLIGAGERRIAQLLNNVDQAISTNSKVALGNVLSEPEVLPVPGFMVDDASPQQPQRPSTLNRNRHSHTSDSGIGSSVADSSEAATSAKSSVRTVTPGAQSFSSISDASDDERGLSKYAAEQIHKHIVKPILREESLKEFHELIKTVPERIGDKEIKNLRDLEKTLIFLAPDYSRSPSKYLRFCERTIRVLHTTVTTLHESDQRAPTDRPYTQGYFFELVEQIRRYATILAITRERQAKGEKLDAMDVTKNEKISIHGGVSRTGKPAELVRHTVDGKVISLATGQTLSTEEIASSSSMKRAAEVDVDDEEAFRSMARRKKNAKPEIHTCELCSKEFKRPCDLTKHVKTHERPWKCSSEDCKYHEYGWPTEKERDRHVNDKHSSMPSLYHCLFKPCPYTSKRESNCKQHMEKAHGWNYVRSKSNGKGRASISSRLPQGSVPPSPASAVLTPIAPSPSNQSWTNSSRHGSMAPPPTTGPSSYNSPAAFGTPAFAQPSPDFTGHFDMNGLSTFDFNAFPSYPLTPAMSEERRASGSLSSHSGAMFDGSSFDNASPRDFQFNDFDFQMNTSDYQQYTPDSSSAGPSAGAIGMHASPGAQMDQTFTSDAMAVDDFNSYAATGGDFTLYGGGSTSGAANGDMFPALSEASWGNLHYSTATPAIPTGNSTLDDLFPELNQ